MGDHSQSLVGRQDPSSHAAPRSSPAPLVVAVGLVVVATTLAVVAIALTWSGPHADASGRETTDTGVQHVPARVESARTTSCTGSVEDAQPDGTVPAQVPCVKVTAVVAGGPDAGEHVTVVATTGTTAAELGRGTRIVLERYPPADGAGVTWAWSDFERGLPLGTLALAFVLVTALVAGARGLRAVLGLAFAAVVVWVYTLPALVAGHSPLVVAAATAVVVAVVVLYLVHGPSVRTTTALLGTLAGMALVGAIGSLAAHAARLPAVTSEDDFQLANLVGDHGVAVLHGVFLCGVVLAGIGVLNDVTVTQVAAVWELRAAQPSAGPRVLFAGGMRIGRDHIASTVYTIAFAYAGASLPVLMLLQLYGQPLGQTLVSGAFAQEIIRTLAGAIGLVLAIPATTAIAAWFASTRHVRARGLTHAH
ncbi:YibE/F family protein [Cellulomonas sp. HZM]|uniref:YibE/F family protein n=1 Tax=Cellulomonas sp. HZM TaxID=1454010 RepID=UPI00068E1AF2|nr:YibE/F family protein [Cellulomonas sp. HZM]